jgi:EmrB/QacA subfamily drug resistance transporter
VKKGTQGQRPPTGTGRRLSYKWLVVIVAIFGTFMSAMDQTIVNIAIPQIQNAFGVDIHSVQWVAAGYILAQGVGTPTTAFFADMLGVKRFYIISIALFTICSILCGLAWSLPVLIAFRLIQGLSEAGLLPMSTAMILSEFAPEERGLAYGFFGVPVLLAPTIAPTLGGFLISAAGWRSIFFINVPVGIVGILLAFLILREQRPKARPHFDLPGFAFVAFGMAAVLYALSEASTDGWGSTLVLSFLSIGLLSLVIFAVIELNLVRREKQPLLDLRIFANGPYTSATLASMLVFFVMLGGGFLTPIYLQNLRGLSAFQAGLLLLPPALVSMVIMAIGGRLVDRFGGKIVTIPGLLIIGLANWQLSFLTLNSPYWWIVGVLMLRGVSLGLAVQPLGVVAVSEIPRERMPLASSLSVVTRSIASSLGIAVVSTLVQSRTSLHYGHLAAQMRAGSQFGQLLSRLQAFFAARGYSLQAAHDAALRAIAGMVQRQAYMLALQEAFLFMTFFIGIAIIATLLVRERHRPKRRAAPVSSQESDPSHTHA